MEVVYDLVLRAIVPGSTKCVTLDMVRRSMSSYFSQVDGTLGADRAALGFRMNTLGSSTWGWIDARRRIGRSTEWCCVGFCGGGGTGATCINEGRFGWAHL